MTSKSKEATRPIGDPTPATDGTLRAKTTLTPKACRVRARISVPPEKVMPIIVVPGIMGTNLRASTVKGVRANTLLKPGEPAWRPPNGVQDGLDEATKWEGRNPANRQNILDGRTLEVDPTGVIDFQGHVTVGEVTQEYARSHGWGEIHWASYGSLLIALKLQFSKFMTCGWEHVPPSIDDRWGALNRFDRALWAKTGNPVLSGFELSEVEKLAGYWYPIYAFGYNWLLSNGDSAQKLKARIEAMISHYTESGYKCEKVLLITHSMGGLVARACAKQIEEKIAGIVHVCMPALGAPVCYRRIACGTEPFNPGNSKIENVAAEKFSDIAGRTAAETNAVMAHAPGALELLPTHLYPHPWLFVSQQDSKNNEIRTQQISFKNPYDFYRDTKSWFRLFQPELIDPANVYGKKAIGTLLQTICQAQVFHENLDKYYHPNTRVIFGVDSTELSYGRYTWSCNVMQVIDQNSLLAGKHVSSTFSGQRSVEIVGGQILFFSPSVQNEPGDGTVPRLSGAGIVAAVKGTFSLSGFDHQKVFGNMPAKSLAIQLMARAILESS